MLDAKHANGARKHFIALKQRLKPACGLNRGEGNKSDWDSKATTSTGQSQKSRGYICSAPCSRFGQGQEVKLLMSLGLALCMICSSVFKLVSQLACFVAL